MWAPGAGEDQSHAAAASPAEEGRQPSDLLGVILAGDPPWPLGSSGGKELPARVPHRRGQEVSAVRLLLLII